MTEENSVHCRKFGVCCNFFGFSPAMVAVKTVIKKVCRTDFPVLIQGETGTGKEMVAEAIHCFSQRAGFPLVKVNCSGLTDSLLASELFGHIKGAFTDAKQDRPGKFTVADKGTLMLDEINSGSLALQASLLRVVERGEIEVVGKALPTKVDVRLIALSDCPLEQEVTEGRFRADLYHRLGVICINMPPLRNRKDDISLFVRMFIHENNQLLGRQIKDISKEALNYLRDHNWPGNIRELGNCIKRAFVLEEGDIISVGSVDFGSNYNIQGLSGHDLNIKNRCDMLERGLIIESLRRTRGNRAGACELLGISPKNLAYYLKKQGLQDTELN